MLTQVGQTHVTEEQRGSVQLLTKTETFAYLKIANRLGCQRGHGVWKRQMRNRWTVIDFSLAEAAGEDRRPTDIAAASTASVA